MGSPPPKCPRSQGAQNEASIVKWTLQEKETHQPPQPKQPQPQPLTQNKTTIRIPVSKSPTNQCPNFTLPGYLQGAIKQTAVSGKEVAINFKGVFGWGPPFGC